MSEDNYALFKFFFGMSREQVDKFIANSLRDPAEVLAERCNAALEKQFEKVVLDSLMQAAITAP